jgi:hypothetical protein
MKSCSAIPANSYLSNRDGHGFRLGSGSAQWRRAKQRGTKFVLEFVYEATPT